MIGQSAVQMLSTVGTAKKYKVLDDPCRNQYDPSRNEKEAHYASQHQASPEQLKTVFWIQIEPSFRQDKKEMTLDCPFRNPLQSRVIPVLSYYLTSYGYLRFYWIRSAAFPPTILRFFHDHPFCCRYYGLTPHM